MIIIITVLLLTVIAFSIAPDFMYSVAAFLLGLAILGAAIAVAVILFVVATGG